MNRDAESWTAVRGSPSFWYFSATHGLQPLGERKRVAVVTARRDRSQPVTGFHVTSVHSILLFADMASPLLILTAVIHQHAPHWNC